MVKQRFLTHFKPWLYAVIKVVGVIVGYQLSDQIRRYFQYPPLNIGDVVVAATGALFALGLTCGIWAWAEWCWFKLRRIRLLGSELKHAFNDVRRPRTAVTSHPLAGRMV
ncbi:MAG: hypothetical protein LAO09_05165 [Acidobacteriia bacterium]|nr:hypothetical protein [Terriglobia bacterium]